MLLVGLFIGSQISKTTNVHKYLAMHLNLLSIYDVLFCIRVHGPHWLKMTDCSPGQFYLRRLARPASKLRNGWVSAYMYTVGYTVYPKKYAHGFVVLCFVVVMQLFIMNSHEVFIHIHQGCFAGTGAIVRLPQCQWSKPNGYGKISQCITTGKAQQSKNRVHISWDIL